MCYCLHAVFLEKAVHDVSDDAQKRRLWGNRSERSPEEEEGERKVGEKEG